MAVLDLFREGFEIGCGISMEQVLVSQKYNELLAQHSGLADKYPSDTDEGIAFRAGHFTTGKLLNILPEQEAIQQAAMIIGDNEHNSTDFWPLIHLLGAHIVEAAKDCLPQQAINWAEEWETATVDQQIEIVRQLYFLFTSIEQRRDKLLSWQTMWENIQADREHNHNDSAATFLPRLYGKWNKDNCPANCQGQTQMLIAFAKLAGAAVMVVGPLVQAQATIENWRAEAFEKIQQDILARDIVPDEEFTESMLAYQQSEFFRRLDWPNFHSCVVFRLKDNRWILLDSHALDWGVFPDVWQLNEIYEKLCKYQQVLPGLSLISHDRDASQFFYAKKIKEVEALLESSRILEAQFGVEPDINAVIQALADSEDLALILTELVGVDPVIVEMVMADEALRYAYAVSMLYGDIMPSLGEMFALIEDRNLLRQKIGSTLTTFHCIAMDRLKNQLQDSGELLHPVCEFSLPEYDISINVLNSLDCRTKEKIPKEFFLNNAFNQLVLCNAMTEVLRSGDCELAYAATRAVEALPFMHGRCRSFFRMYGHLSKEEANKK